MADIAISAVSLFFMRSEPLLAYQRGLEEGRRTSNCMGLFGMAAIPTLQDTSQPKPIRLQPRLIWNKQEG